MKSNWIVGGIAYDGTREQAICSHIEAIWYNKGPKHFCVHLDKLLFGTCTDVGTGCWLFVGEIGRQMFVKIFEDHPPKVGELTPL